MTQRADNGRRKKRFSIVPSRHEGWEVTVDVRRASCRRRTAPIGIAWSASAVPSSSSCARHGLRAATIRIVSDPRSSSCMPDARREAPSPIAFE